MPTVKQSPEETVTGDLRPNNDRKPKAFEELETDRESYDSYSYDTETYSPKSVVSTMKVFRRRVRNQIERIRAEDSHLGEDIAESLIARVCGGGNGVDDAVVFSRPASPLSGGTVAGCCVDMTR